VTPVTAWLCVASDDSVILQYVMGYYCTVLLSVCFWYWRWTQYFVSVKCDCFLLCVVKTLNGLWTVLSNIDWIFCGQFFVISILCCQYFALSINCGQYWAISIVDSIAQCQQWTCRKRKFHVFKSIPTVPIAYRNGYTLTVGDCFLLSVFVVATAGLQCWAADQVLDRATTTDCCYCLAHWTLNLL
jgi:hypothetical protein